STRWEATGVSRNAGTAYGCPPYISTRLVMVLVIRASSNATRAPFKPGTGLAAAVRGVCGTSDSSACRSLKVAQAYRRTRSDASDICRVLGRSHYDSAQAG